MSNPWKTPLTSSTTGKLLCNAVISLPISVNSLKITALLGPQVDLFVLCIEFGIWNLEFGISYRRQQKMQQTFQLLSIILIQQTLVAANAVLVLNDFFYRHVVFLIVF